MRGLRSTIALMVVLAGLGGYIYYYFDPIKTAEREKAVGEKEKVFAALQADKIDEITVTSAAGDATTVKKDGGAWQVIKPVTTKADESEVSGITSALGSTDLVRVIDENPTNLNDYGLSNPRIEVDFKTTGDATVKKLLIGEKSPTGADLFAKRND